MGLVLIELALKVVAPIYRVIYRSIEGCLPERGLHLSDVVGVTDAVVLTHRRHHVVLVLLFRKFSFRETDRRLEGDRNLGRVAGTGTGTEAGFLKCGLHIEGVPPEHVFRASDLLLVHGNRSNCVQS